MVKSNATITLSPGNTSMVVITEASEKVPPDRQLFKEMENGQYVAFIEEVEKAQADSETWVSEPFLVAENFMQWPAGEPGCREEHIIKVSESSIKAEYVIENYECPDDSVRDMAYYVELTNKESYWTISWIGMMWRCARAGEETLNAVWHTRACP